MPLTRITSEEILDLTIREEDLQDNSVGLSKLNVDESGAGANFVLATDGAGNLIIIDPISIGSTTLGGLTDVDLTTPASVGQVLTFDGNNWIPASGGGGGASSLNDLVDVTLSSPGNTQVLKYNGVSFVNASVDYAELTNTPTIPTNASFTFVGLSDTNATPVANTFLKWNGAGDTVEYATISASDVSGLAQVATTGSLESLGNVFITNVQHGEVLKFDTGVSGGSWVNSTDNTGSGGGVTELNDLSDVTLGGSTALSAGQVLIVGGDNVNWENREFILDDLGDVQIGVSPTAGNVIRYNGTFWGEAQLAYSDLSGTPTLSTVATTGDYNDLTNKPSVPVVISDLGDADTTGAVNGSILRYNGAAWVVGTDAGATQLNDLSDVVIATAASGEVLRFDGTNWVDAQLAYSDLSGTPTIPTLIEDLSNVDVTGVTTGDVLTYNGTAWVPAEAGTGGGTVSVLDDLLDVAITGAATGEVLRYNGTNWVDAQLSYSDLTGTPTLSTVATTGDYNDLLNLPSIPAVISDLSDVDTTGAVSGNILEYNGTNWVVGTASGGASAINDLTDVTITSAATGEVLRFDGTNWVDAQLAYSDLSGTPTLSTVATTGSYNDLTDTPTVPSSINDLSDVNTTGLTNGSILKYNGTAWVVSTDATGETNTMTNLGAGEGVFLQKSGVEFQLKSLVAGTNVSITSTSNEITIDASGAGGASALNDLTDVTISSAATGEVLRFNGSAWVDTQLAYSDLTGTPTLSTVATTGDYNDLINQPTIPGTIEDLSNVDTTGAISGSVLKYNGTNWVVGTDDTSAGGGEANTASNLGAGTGVFAQKNGVDLEFKSLVAGTNVTLSSDASTVTINASGAGGASTLNDLTDVTLSSPATGEVLRYNGSAWVDVQLDYSDLTGTPTIPTVSSDLSDIDTTGAVNGSVLKYNGTTWVVGTDDTSGSSALGDLTDVTIGTPASGEVLRYDGTNWVDAQLDYSDLSGTPTLATVATTGDYNDLLNLPTIPGTIEDLSNVDTTGAVSGSVLKYNGTNWVVGTDDTGSGGEANTASNLGAGTGVFAQKNGVDLEFKSLVGGTNVTLSSDASTITINAAGGGATTLNDLTDVDTTTTTPTSGDVLTYDGTEWAPAAPSGGSGGAQVERVKLNYATNGDLVSATDTTSGISAVNILAPTAGTVEFKFTGLAYPPSSIIMYGYAYTANEYLVQNTTFGSMNTATIQAGGSSGSPIAFGTFSDASVGLTLTLSEAETGASRSFGTTTHAWIQFVF